MNKFISRYATPLTTGLFAVSAVSGVALFFHIASGAFHSMHEWLSIALLAPFALHIWKNWRSLVGYLRTHTLVLPVVASILVAIPFAVSGLSRSSGGNPAIRAISVLTQARVADLAPLLHTTPDALLAVLKAKGYKAESTEQTLSAIATASGTQGAQILFAVMPAPTR